MVSQDSLQQLFLYYPCSCIYYILANELLGKKCEQYKLIIKYSLKENNNQIFYQIARKFNYNDYIETIAKYSMKYCDKNNWKERLDFIFKLIKEKKKKYT
jgi:hypothetical protein